MMRCICLILADNGANNANACSETYKILPSSASDTESNASASKGRNDCAVKFNKVEHRAEHCIFEFFPWFIIFSFVDIYIDVF